MKIERKPLIYIASPYKHDDRTEQAYRYDAIKNLTAKIISDQDLIIPFAPIAYTVLISQKCPGDFDWYTWDLQFLARCDGMIVVKLPEWEDSEGIKIEIEFCKEHCIPMVQTSPKKIIDACEKIHTIITKV